jgi:chromosomal replication initiation ATPase DnaA
MIPDAQLLLEFEHSPGLGAEDFLPAPCNREALAWLERWPAWPAPVLVLYGPEGCGKSHLARVFAARTGARWMDAAALPEEPPQRATSMVLDPAEPVPDELAMLRLYNRLKEEGAHALLTARRPVAAWEIRLPDLASRLRAAPAVAIGPPDDTLLAALLVKLFADRQVTASQALIGYLVRHMERSFAAARRIVEQLDRLSLQQGRPATVALARRLLERLPQDQDGDQRDES